MEKGICKLPFIEQEKLLSATKPLEQKVEVRLFVKMHVFVDSLVSVQYKVVYEVQEWEAKRNISSTDKLFIGASNRFKFLMLSFSFRR